LIKLLISFRSSIKSGSSLEDQELRDFQVMYDSGAD
jgi:hypothetical protein